MYHGNSLKGQIIFFGEIKDLSSHSQIDSFFCKGILLCCFEGCTNPLTPVPTGIIPPKTTFSFRPFNHAPFTDQSQLLLEKENSLQIWNFEYWEMLLLSPVRRLGNRSLLRKRAPFVLLATIQLVLRDVRHSVFRFDGRIYILHIMNLHPLYIVIDKPFGSY